MRETKITADHLKRDAYLYVRQSSPRQVTEHNESTQRQYALRNRAIAAGWPVERIRVIDCDLGKSASMPRRHATAFSSCRQGRYRHGTGSIAPCAQVIGVASPH